MVVEPKDILIIIPAYNEERSLQSVINGLREHGYDKILVVDDGSSDKTFEIANRSNVYVASHLLNRGPGSASATGFEIAKILNPEIVVTVDADGQHHAGDIAKLIEPIQKDGIDIVIGSRMLPGSAMPWRRRLYNKIANLVTYLLYNFSLSDTQSGLKAFNRRAYHSVKIESSGMEFCSEIVHKIKEKGLRFKEIEVRPIYTNYSLSKGQNFIMGLKTLSRLVFNRLTRR